jgi:hypothetical protein
MTIGRRPSPAAVSRYSAPPGTFTRSTTPISSSLRSRCTSNVVDIRGTPRRMSLKWVLPHISSRTTSGVQRSPKTSAARATGQNCP